VALKLNNRLVNLDPEGTNTELDKQLLKKINQAISEKLKQQGVISFFSGDSIENKPIHEREFSARTINAIRGHFGLNSHKEITVQHLKIIHNVGSEYVRGLGVACQREIRWYLEELGIIDKQ
jgi:hypothetical protein